MQYLPAAFPVVAALGMTGDTCLLCCAGQALPSLSHSQAQLLSLHRHLCMFATGLGNGMPWLVLPGLYYEVEGRSANWEGGALIAPFFSP